MIEQVSINDPVTISKFNFNCDDVISEDIPYPLPKSTFKLGIVGKSGCGKTSLLRSLTERGGKNRIYANRLDEGVPIFKESMTLGGGFTPAKGIPAKTAVRAFLQLSLKSRGDSSQSGGVLRKKSFH